MPHCSTIGEQWFLTLDEARAVIEDWRQDYNEFRPHSSLGDLTEQFRDRSAGWTPEAQPIGSESQT
jgi:transposase InsO family protein